jgi:hypothetical protein
VSFFFLFLQQCTTKALSLNKIYDDESLLRGLVFSADWSEDGDDDVNVLVVNSPGDIYPCQRFHWHPG